MSYVEKVQLGMYSTLLAGLINAHVTHARIATAGVNKLNDYGLINLASVQKCCEIGRTSVQISSRKRAVCKTDLLTWTTFKKWADIKLKG